MYIHLQCTVICFYLFRILRRPLEELYVALLGWFGGSLTDMVHNINSSMAPAEWHHRFFVDGCRAKGGHHLCRASSTLLRHGDILRLRPWARWHQGLRPERVSTLFVCLFLEGRMCCIWLAFDCFCNLLHLLASLLSAMNVSFTSTSWSRRIGGS